LPAPVRPTTPTWQQQHSAQTEGKYVVAVVVVVVAARKVQQYVDTENVQCVKCLLL
jgi:hypothetical protein